MNPLLDTTEVFSNIRELLGLPEEIEMPLVITMSNDHRNAILVTHGVYNELIAEHLLELSDDDAERYFIAIRDLVNLPDIFYQGLQVVLDTEGTPLAHCSILLQNK